MFTGTKAAGTASPILHDEGLPLLKAAINIDPRPNKSSTSIAVTDGTALLPNAGPEGSVQKEGGSNNGQISLYVVREGDSLSYIAEMFDVSVNTILWANDIASAKSIQPGDTLFILPVSGVKHIVQKGETLAGIVKKYNSDLEDVASYNRISSSAAVSVGTEIIIPGGELAPKKIASSTGISAKVSSAPLPALSGFFGNPIAGGRITQGIHGYNGIDVGAPSGTAIYAAASGTVLTARASGYNGGYGSYVVIDHGNGTQTLYAHMSSVSAVAGTTVEKGATIGRVGNTGRSTGFHLHFEVRGAKNPLAN